MPFDACIKILNPHDLALYSAHRTLCLMVRYMHQCFFCQGHALLHVCLWKEDYQLLGTANVLTPG